MNVIVDQRAEEAVFSALEGLGFNVIKSFDFAYIYEPVNTHPDLQIHFTDDKTAVVAPKAFNYYRKQIPREITLIKGDKDPGAAYPEDCAYNAARIGNNVFGNLKFIDREIIRIYESMNMNFINVKQGYTKCGTCIVGDNAAITEDEGIFKALTENGVDALKINVGEVVLNGFEYGFIGGATGLSGRNLIFCGDVSAHSDHTAIKNFLDDHKVDIINLLQTKFYDYGSLIFF